MEFLTDNYWWLVLACVICIPVTAFLMKKEAKKFYTMSRIRQAFSMFDLQFASTSEELIKLITGIDDLNDKIEIKRALKRHLYIDFLFMPAMYFLIFLLCFATAMKMDTAGRTFFFILAYVQVIPFLLDASENVFLLRKIKKPVITSENIHKIYRYAVLGKWLIASFAAISAISALSYFWISGDFNMLK